ncbi:DUF4942 domain-containing protein [Pseudomonas aeruginosa]|uniref:DUF4942 domain-containing protein n=1 Tax=Pseudomonas aeruginosa TaxID=287 RepID=UPI000EB5FA62|nr:DUF4942 domain-containing protein [Pseudomonas aeruginosa]
MTAFQSNLFAANDQPKSHSEFIGGGSDYASAGLTSFDMIDQLLGLYRQREQAIEATKQFIDSAFSHGVMNYFIEGARLLYGPEYRYSIPNDTEAAKATLRAEFWLRLLNDAQIFEVMPIAKREQARSQFSGLDCPPFDESTVRPTLENLLAARKTYFAERVDGIFFGLSRVHVSNSPAGFSKKMILANVYESDGYVNTHKAGLISDLRGVVGRISGRGEPSEYATRKLLGNIYRKSIGKKVQIDGGAFTLVVYRKGTVHFEVAEEVAVELNSILATLYPTAIPSKFRTPSKVVKKTNSFDLKVQRLSMAVIDLLSSLERRGDTYSSSIYTKSEECVEQTSQVLRDIGAAVKISADKYYLYAQFDFDADPVIDQLIYSGVVPEKAAYQWYPTRSEIGAKAAALLDARPGHNCCEPQAGTGDLAQYLPKDSTLCIELAQVRVKVLEAKGYTTVKADFLDWAVKNSSMRFDRILMNPPFSHGRAGAHLEAAASLLAADGRLVAILPASMINSTPLDGFKHVWSEVFEDQFEGTSVRVAILTAERC